MSQCTAQPLSDSDVKDLDWSHTYPLMCPSCYISFPVSGHLIWRSDTRTSVVCPDGHRFFARLGRIAYPHLPRALREW